MTDTLPKCLWCDVPVRKRSYNKNEFPGSHLYQAKGLCTLCYRQSQLSGGKGVESLERVLDKAVDAYWNNRDGGPIDARAIL